MNVLLNRRALLARLGVGAGSTLGAGWLTRAGLAGAGAGLVAASGGTAANAVTDEQLPAEWTQPLALPPVLTDADIALEAVEADVQLLNGAPTKMWVFKPAGSEHPATWPGPTIRRPSGETTRVTVTNLLPEDAGADITIHHHGGHQAAEYDGGPLAAHDPIARDTAKTYVYELVEDGAGERAATQWYHDHTHFRTGRNNWFGLQGLFLVTDEFEDALNLPTGDQDLALVVANRDFTADNQLTDLFTAPTREEQDAISGGYVNGTTFPNEEASAGPTFFVNGTYTPFVELQARRHRLRLMNASALYTLNFMVGDGIATATRDRVDLVQIGTEAGLMPAAVTRRDAYMGPADRIEVIVDLSGMEGQELYLSSFPGAEGGQGLTGGYNAPVVRDLMKIKVVAPAPTDSDDSVTTDELLAMAPLRPLPEWTSELSATPHRVWVFGQGVDDAGRAAWTINGKAFDHDRVDAQVALDSTETWLIANTTTQTHFIHIHDVDWLVLERNGAAPPAWENGVKETFRVDPGEYVLVGSKFTDHQGLYMMHCHMLEHEDHGMMTTWEVVGPGEADPIPHPSIESAIRAGVATPAAAEAAVRVVTAATGGRPAPRHLIEAVNAGLGLPTGPPTGARLYCSLNDTSAPL